MALSVDFVDDVLDSTMEGQRRYEMTTNSDGSISLEDVTTYTQTGSSFGATQINETNEAINNLSNFLGPYTITSESTSYTVTDTSILEDSLINIYYAEDSKEVVSDAEASYAQEAGTLTITFETAIASDVTIDIIHVINPF